MRKAYKIPLGSYHVIVKDRTTKWVIYEGVVSHEYRKTLTNNSDLIVITLAN